MKVGTDIFVFENKSYIVVVDYLTNYIEVEELQNTHSNGIISRLKQIFSRNGIPRTIVSDNGP